MNENVAAVAVTAVFMGCTLIGLLMVFWHRQQMVKLKARETGLTSGEVRELRDAVSVLQDQVHSQVIALDNLVANQARLIETQTVQQRLLAQRLGDGAGDRASES